MENRINLLMDMDTYIRNNCNSTGRVYWFSFGIPKENNITHFLAIASDSEKWVACCKAFARACEWSTH